MRTDNHVILMKLGEGKSIIGAQKKHPGADGVQENACVAFANLAVNDGTAAVSHCDHSSV